MAHKLKASLDETPLTSKEKAKLFSIQNRIDERKRKIGHEVMLPLGTDTTREIVRDLLKLPSLPARGTETERLIVQIESNPKLLEEFISMMAYATNGITRPGRLAATEKAISDHMYIFMKRGPFHVLDVGVGATDSEELRAVTTIELAGYLACRAHHVTVFGGDIRLNKLEEFDIWGSRMILFPLDILKPEQYIARIYEKFGFDTFDIVRCCNLLGHYKPELQNKVRHNLLKLARCTSLVIYNSELERVYTLIVNANGISETKLIMPS